MITTISSSEIKSLITMPEAIELMKPAFRQLSDKTAVVPIRINMDMKKVNAQSLIMPVYLPDSDFYAVKIVSLNYDNPKKKLPFIHAILHLFDAKTGQPLAMMDAEELTAIRTGASSGLATDYLAMKNASVLALFGAGVQGRKQIDAILAVRPITTVFIFDIDLEKATQYAKRVQSETGVQSIASSDQRLLAKADIICTATTSSRAVFTDRYLKKSVHINGIGAYHPGLIEIPAETISRANVFVDQRESCLQEAGDLIYARNNSLFNNTDVIAELGEIESLSDYKKFRNQLTIFKSVGNAVQDLALAAKIYGKYLSKRGKGTQR